MQMHIKKYLTKQSVLEIFAARPRPTDAAGDKVTKHEKSLELANKYGVSNKTIQQIWNRKSWVKLTQRLFNEESESSGNTTQPQSEDQVTENLTTLSHDQISMLDTRVRTSDWGQGESSSLRKGNRDNLICETDSWERISNFAVDTSTNTNDPIIWSGTPGNNLGGAGSSHCRIQSKDQTSSANSGISTLSYDQPSASDPVDAASNMDMGTT
eukprot:1568356-Rhodomonas_salina.1